MAINLKKTCLICLMSGLMVCLVPGTVVANDKDLPVIELFGKHYYKYEVKKKETLYSLSRRFGVTQEELLMANPSLSEGLKSGQLLLIPVKDAAVIEEAEAIVKAVAAEEETAPTLVVTSKGIHYQPGDLPRITLLLPIDEQATAALNERYVEFYEGFLLAVDSLKALGLSFEVQALQVGSGTDRLAALIAGGALDNTDYCIGGAGSAQIALLSDWARKHRKATILPFSSRIPEVAGNSYLYQPLVSQEKMQERLVAFLSIRFAGSNVVLLKKSEPMSSAERALTDALKARLKQQGSNYLEVVPDETLEALFEVLTEHNENVIVPYDMSLNEATRFIAHLAAAAAKQPEKPITLIGYPEWQAMNRRNLPLLHQLNTHLYTSFYADFQQPAVREFQINYNRNFGKSLLNTFPKYGMMGYDLASYFIPRMVSEQTNSPLVKGLESLQQTFGFRPEGSGSGSYNLVFYFVQFSPDNRVVIKQLR